MKNLPLILAVVFIVLVLATVFNMFVIFEPTPTGYSIVDNDTSLISNQATALPNQRKVVRNSTEAIHVIYQKNLTSFLHKSSTDDSYSWSSAHAIDNFPTTSCRNSTLVINSTDDLIAICGSTDGTYVSVEDGVTWTRVSTSDKGTEQSAYIDKYDKIRVAFHILSAGQTTIYYTESSDGGYTWSTAVNVSEISTTIKQDPSVVADPYNATYVMWTEYDSDEGQSIDIYFSECNELVPETMEDCADGDSWSSPALVYDSTDISESISSVITENGYVHIAFTDNSTANREIYHSKYNGSAWSSPVNISSDSQQDTKSSIATNGTVLYVIWHNISSVIADDTGFTNEIFLSHSNDSYGEVIGTWSTKEQITNNNLNDTYPSSNFNVTSKIGLIRMGDEPLELYFENIWTEENVSNLAVNYYINDKYSPLWRDIGQNNSTPAVGEPVLLYAMSGDTIRSDYALLETNETGSFENKTQNYSSPLLMNVSNQWKWSNFTWDNDSIGGGTTISWRIYYNDTSGNEILTNTKNFTVGETPSNEVPQWSGDSTNVLPNYTESESYFDITWTDDLDVDTVFIETNYSNKLAAGENFTMYNAYGDVYRYNDTIGVGTAYYWKSYANDTDNEWNSSDTWYFTVYQAPTSVNLYLNGTEENRTLKRYTTANLTAKANSTITTNLSTNLTGWVEIQNTTLIYNTTNLTDIDGIYNITAYTIGNENFTANSTLHYLVIDGTAPSSSNPSASPSSPTGYGITKEYTFSITWVDIDYKGDSFAVSDVILQFDGTNYSYLASEITKTGNSYSKTFIGLSIGDHSYKWYSNDSVNNWGNSSTYSYIIQSSLPGGGGGGGGFPEEPPEEEEPPTGPSDPTESPEEQISLPDPGTVITIPKGGVSITLKPNLFLNLYGKNATIHNITEIEAGRYKVLLCDQADLASYEINVTVDLAYFCINYSDTTVLEPTISIYKFFRNDWTELEPKDIFKDTSKKLICGNISSTPYMVAGFSRPPTADIAFEAITSANSSIIAAQEQGIDIYQAQELLTQALEAYYVECNYEDAIELAKKAKELLISIPPTNFFIVFIIILLILTVSWFWYGTIRRKVKVEFKRKTKK